MTNRTHMVLVALGGALLATACQPTPEGWIPVLEMTSTDFIETETDRALEHLDEAHALLRSDPSGSEEAL